MGGGGIIEIRRCANSGLVGTNGDPVVSVVIVNFSGGPLLSEAVRSALQSTIPVEVYVSDNGSTDGSLSSLRHLAAVDRRLQIIENRTNLGFARAANVALERAQGKYVLLLNPDAVIQPDTLVRMIGTLAAYPDVGMAGCLLRNPDGTEQAGCRRSVPTPWRTLVRVLHLDKLFPNHPRFRNFILTQQPLPETPVFLEAISGAFMLVRRKALEDVGYLDEKYFLHCEDLDWCMRFRQAGWKILFVPNVEVVHHQGTCSKSKPVFVLWHKHKGMIRFYRKFFHNQYPWPLMPLVLAAVWMRFMLLAGMALFQSQESSEPANEKRNQIAMKQAAQEKSITLPAVEMGTDSVEIDPMLVISSSETEHPYRRPF
jgi:hypothetical protein